MDQADITRRYAKVLKPGYGAIADDELGFLHDLIATHRPKAFLEVGMASGLSTGFIAAFMEEQGSGQLVSIDYDDTFFGDKSKPNGFLVPELYSGTAVDVVLRKFTSSPDIADFPGPYDMAFVDANHQHPWPAIDMMAVYPYLTGPRLVVHHDLQLFRVLNYLRGTGPKLLFDQFPESHRLQSDARQGNIFAVDLTLGQDRFERILDDLFRLPWSINTPLHPGLVDKIRTLLKTHYSRALLAGFDESLAFYNKPEFTRDGARYVLSWLKYHARKRYDR